MQELNVLATFRGNLLAMIRLTYEVGWAIWVEERVFTFRVKRDIFLAAVLMW